MIELTSLKGEIFYINIDRIEKMEVHSDTILTLIDGKVVRVVESPETIVQLIVEFKRRIHWR